MKKHGPKKIFHSRLLTVGSLMVLQALILIIAIWKFNTYFLYFYSFCVLLSAVEVFTVINKDYNPAYKLAICIPILLIPIFGGLFYIFLGNSHLSKKQKKELLVSSETMDNLLIQDKEVYKRIRDNSKSVANQVKYVFDTCGYPVYENTESTYLSPGETLFEKMKDELKKAEKYIFIEYFIINEGKMWSEILDILKEKAKDGVDVRVIYDDVGCIDLLPYNYDKELECYGIKCRVFNRLTPVVSMWHNNRDHRKITVIDGDVAFTGGANIADEYINEYERFGYWKDSGIMIKGDAVWSFTFMFLSFWKAISGEEVDYESFKSSKDNRNLSDGFVMPYGDTPLDNETLGENIYLNAINKANRYINICTPYFVVDNETMTSICLAAKSGVDVRIVTPHIEDKWYVHMITRSYYRQLIESGVKVYEYTPGFIHSKTVVADGDVGIVGSINFDFRSMYLTFECAVYMYKTKGVKELEQDFEDILKVSQRITLEDCNKEKLYKRILIMFLRIFSPLL